MGSPNIKDVYGFIRGYVPGIAHWTKEELMGWLEWVSSNDFVLLSFDNGSICGLGVARAVERPERGRDYYHYFTGTKHVFVDLAINLEGYDLKPIVEYIPVRFPNVETVSFNRLDRKQERRIRTYEYERFKKLVK